QLDLVLVCSITLFSPAANSSKRCASAFEMGRRGPNAETTASFCKSCGFSVGSRNTAAIGSPPVWLSLREPDLRVGCACRSRSAPPQPYSNSSLRRPASLAQRHDPRSAAHSAGPDSASMLCGIPPTHLPACSPASKDRPASRALECRPLADPACLADRLLIASLLPRHPDDPPRIPSTRPVPIA